MVSTVSGRRQLLNISDVSQGTSQHVSQLDTVVYVIILLPAVIHHANLELHIHK